MRRVKNLLITLTVLLPAIVLVALYPRMGQVYEQKVVELEAQESADNAETTVVGGVVGYVQPIYAEYELSSNFVNYAMEASYYLYGEMLQESRGTEVDISVLDNYGWINDYYTLSDSCEFYTEYETDVFMEGSIEKESFYRKQTEHNLGVLLHEDGHSVRVATERNLAADGYLGYLVIRFNEYGNIYDISFVNFGNIYAVGGLYQHAKESINQYENNVAYYNDANVDKIDASELRPKSFDAVFLLDSTSMFVVNNMGVIMESSNHPHHIFSLMGVEWLLVAALSFVAIMAFILPFFKKLNTGWEKIFSIPFEIMCIIIAGTCCGVAIMYELMVSCCYPVLMETLELYGTINIIGYDVTPDTIYYVMLGVNFIGWALVFFLEYISVSAIRQFLFRPVYYLKTRVLCIRIVSWIWKQCKRVYHYVTDINIGKGLNKSILKIVIANFLIVGVCCCFWFVGWIGVLIYSVILYVILRKFGFNLQSRYEAVLKVTTEMAEGNLKTQVPTDLGVFSEFGEALSKVQSGFSKAVAEEAKSQNMKTELITNVSHDLKTPLTAIITYVDLLKKEDITEEERKEYVDTLDKKSQRLKVLIEDLFEVSKASSNNITLYCTDIDLVNLLKQVCLENEDKIVESTLDFRWNLPEKKCVSHLDPNRTYRVMDNLIQNILKYSMPHSRVYIDMEETDNEYVIHFKNMSATEMNFDASEITERFVRGDLSRNTEGSGLGLAIAQSFTEMQGGKFEVQIDGDLFKVNLAFDKSV